MPKVARPRAENTVYNHREIGIRIEKLREKRGLERKAVYSELGIEKGEYSRKVGGKTPFTLWEISTIWELLQAPPGWPFVTESEGERLRAR